MAYATVAYSRPKALGACIYQEVDFTFASGDTSASITVPSIAKPFFIHLGAAVKHTAAPTFSGNVITLAVSVPASTAATKVSQGLTFTAVATDRSGNLINVAFKPTPTSIYDSF